jgi:hypothetical protein
MAALIRYSSAEGFALFPPAMTPDGQWHEIRSNHHGPTHTFAQVARVLAGQAAPNVLPAGGAPSSVEAIPPE